MRLNSLGNRFTNNPSSELLTSSTHTSYFLDQQQSGITNEPATHTVTPYVVGASVLGIRCVDGVALASDTLASYGSMAKFMTLSRLHQVNDHVVLGVGGEYSDFQEIKKVIDRETNTQYCYDDGYVHSPKSYHQMLSRVMYSKRNKMDPLWNSILLGGWDLESNKPYLGFVDLYGTHFESEVVASGYGLYLALPLLRKAFKDTMTVAEGAKVLEDCMKVLYYRDARTINSIQIATVTKDGVNITAPYELETKWDFKQFVQGSRGKDDSTW